MKITTIYWREDALSNLKDILAMHRRKGKLMAKRIIDSVGKTIEEVKKHPYNGYNEASMLDQPQKIYSHVVGNRRLKMLYYTENDTLYIIDFQED
ncbi:MAG: hypothetical protein LBG18_07615 [Mediterranea sp.]|jgi:plasmid stabilization system protein ParE|nr:hypothetical protein [Mediterranea sp.]